jgi:hypothetical protein
MSKTKNSDPLIAEIERALVRGKYIRYSETCSFVEGLEKVQKQLESLAPEASGRAVRLFEMFLSGCYAKIEECDDSSAYLSMFFHSLFCGWIKARQAMGLPADETVRQILKWMERDNYGFCYRIEPELVKALDSDGNRLLIAHFHNLIAAALQESMPGHGKAIFEYDNKVRLPALSLKDIYLSTKSVAPYVALCDRLGFSPLDCERLAEVEIFHKHWHQALVWAEKGLALEPTRNWHNESSHSLAQLRLKILAKAGRKEDALAAAWSQFEVYPSEMAYEELIACVPKSDKPQWHDKAMMAATKGEVGEFMRPLCQNQGMGSVGGADSCGNGRRTGGSKPLRLRASRRWIGKTGWAGGSKAVSRTGCAHPPEQEKQILRSRLETSSTRPQTLFEGGPRD